MTREGAKSWWGIELPKNVHHLIKEIGKDWQEVTYKEINARRKAKQDFHIYEKRASEEVRPCVIWVFYNQPLWSMSFGGWYLYVRTLKGDFPLNWKWPRKDLIMQVKQLFSCGFLPFGDIYDECWFAAFEKKYHRPGKRKKNAVAFAKCRFNKRGDIVEIMR